MNEADPTIEALVADATPVRRLRAPLRRTLIWVGLALTVATIIGVIHGLRPDLHERLAEPLFVLGMFSALATGVLGAFAALMASLPDRSRRWLLLPLPAALLWVGGITGGCLLRWVTLDPDNVSLGVLLNCLGILTAVSVPLSAALFWMLRPLMRVAPPGTVLMAGFATAALAAAALNLLHDFDASLTILVWNFGAALLVLGFDLLVARMVGASRFRPAPRFQAAR